MRTLAYKESKKHIEMRMDIHMNAALSCSMYTEYFVLSLVCSVNLQVYSNILKIVFLTLYYIGTSLEFKR